MKRTTTGDILEQVARVNEALGNPRVQRETHNGQNYEVDAYKYTQENGGHNLVLLLNADGSRKHILYADTKARLSDQLYSLLKGIDLGKQIS